MQGIRVREELRRPKRVAEAVSVKPPRRCSLYAGV
jgi:hypothetical protein